MVPRNCANGGNKLTPENPTVGKNNANANKQRAPLSACQSYSHSQVASSIHVPPTIANDTHQCFGCGPQAGETPALRPKNHLPAQSIRNAPAAQILSRAGDFIYKSSMHHRLHRRNTSSVSSVTMRFGKVARSRAFLFGTVVLTTFGAHDVILHNVRSAPPRQKRFTPGSAG